MISLSQANERYRYVFRRGMTGWDCKALQIALNTATPSPKLATDGIFGPITEAAVKAIQKTLGITVDGIAGPQTQSTLCIYQCNQPIIVPKGLMKGICLGESGGIIPCTSPVYPNATRDYGPLQDNLPVTSNEETLARAFDPAVQVRAVSASLKAAHDLYLPMVGVKGSQEQAWRLAVLYYNWPAAAMALARGEGSTWTYIESGTGVKRKLTDPAPWIEAYGIPNVTTGLQWCAYYIASKSAYVTSWSV